MDADIVVFDPARVIDRATCAEPAQPSVGFVHVLLNGTPVVRDEKLVKIASGHGNSVSCERPVTLHSSQPPAVQQPDEAAEAHSVRVHSLISPHLAAYPWYVRRISRGNGIVLFSDETESRDAAGVGTRRLSQYGTQHCLAFLARGECESGLDQRSTPRAHRVRVPLGAAIVARTSTIRTIPTAVVEGICATPRCIYTSLPPNQRHSSPTDRASVRTGGATPTL
jgi:hypothetical protein